MTISSNRAATGLRQSLSWCSSLRTIMHSETVAGLPFVTVYPPKVAFAPRKDARISGLIAPKRIADRRYGNYRAVRECRHKDCSSPGFCCDSPIVL